MKITKTIINTLLKEESEEQINSVANYIVDNYYDKEKDDFTIDITSRIKTMVNQNEVDKVIDKINELINTSPEEQKQAPDDQTEVNNSIDPELEKVGQKIVKILNNYGVKSKLIDVQVGPSVTQYEIEPEAGTRVNQITNLSKELAMGIPARKVSVDPIEGRTTIGIQVPNEKTTSVELQDVLDNSESSGVSVALGRNMNGDAVSADILKMQHVLIGGATGSGKSACINSMICSLIEQYSPEQVKLVLIDPKKVELSQYASVPHLLMPIVTDPKQAADTLNDMVKEMDKRYQIFSKVRVKNIDSYNELVDKYKEAGNNASYMPYIIIVIDELADLMMTAGKSVESSIQRITQLARAAGIHLIVATQRPSVDVVTGVIKSNIPSRIAFSTASGVDSRTILDQQGAEKLLGKGDMLFKPNGETNPTRIQGAYVTDDDVDNIVNSAIKKYQTNSEETDNTVEETDKEENKKEEIDQNYEKAVELLKDLKKISTANLQLKLHIPYKEATRIIDKLEQNGLIKSQSGRGPRKVVR